MKALVVKTNGEINVIDQEWNYDQINAAVGGWLEVIEFPHYRDHFAYINEEGKILGLDVNEIVTRYWYDSGATILVGDQIVGDAVFFGEIDEDGENTEIPESLLQRIEKYRSKVYG